MSASFENMTHPSQRTSTVLHNAIAEDTSFDNITQHKQYIFTPAGLEVKLTLSVLIAVAAAVGFAGNLCVLRFTNNEENKPVRARRSSNLNYFIRGLALSDVLGNIVGAPLMVLQANFDLFQSRWPCMVSRYFQTVFMIITIYNLVVISIERFICTCRPTSRPISLRTVTKAVKAAWLLGFLLNLPFSYPFGVTRVDLNGTHYTLVCWYNTADSTSSIIQKVRLVLGYVLPFIIIVSTCVSVIRTVWKKRHCGVNTHQTNAEVIRALNMKRKKATNILTTIMIAFVVPYLFFFVYPVYLSIYTPAVEFKIDYAIRLFGGSLMHLNSVANFVIHLVQLNGFRQTMISYLMCRADQGGNQTMELGRSRALKTEGFNQRRASMSQIDDPKRSGHHTNTRRESLY